MTMIERRTILRSMTGIVASIPFVGDAFRTTARHGRNSPLWKEAVRLMRLINTVEFRHRTATGEYVEPWILDTVANGRELIATMPAKVRFDRTRHMVGPFRVFWREEPGEYQVSLVDPESGFAVFSDTVGEIFYGEARSHAHPGSAPSLREQLAFKGTSIGRNPFPVLAAITGFFAPTLYADATKCCDNRDKCTCTAASGMCSGTLTACNTGCGGNCNWCCSTDTNCQTCVPDGCTCND